MSLKPVDIAIKNLKTIFRDKKSALFLILIPIMYYSLMGFVFGGNNSNNDTYIYRIGVVDLDDSENFNPFKNVDFIIDTINKTDNINLILFENNDSAFISLKNKKIDSYFIIPQDFELYINQTIPSLQDNITLYFRDSTSDLTKSIVENMIIGIISGIVNYNPNSISIPYNQKTISGSEINNLTIGTPGYLMYGILSGLSSIVILLTMEKKEGLLKRLETSRMQPVDMLSGHLLSNTIVIFLQFVLGILVLSIWGFQPTYSDVFSLIFGLIVTVLLLSFFLNALGLVSAIIFKTPDAGAGGVWIILIPLMTFSGAFFPLEFVMPQFIPYVSWIPTRIVVLLFQDLMINAVSIFNIGIWVQFLWLILESLIFFLIGVKMYIKFAQD